MIRGQGALLRGLKMRLWGLGAEIRGEEGGEDEQAMGGEAD
jgi:TRAP-type mannitol/chloroaromatic compound transport system substrate-binding protein